MNISGDVPNPTTPIIDPNGYMNQVWYQFFLTLLQRTGGTEGLAPITEVTGVAPIFSSGGLTPAISISQATTLLDGSMSAADKVKLNGIGDGANVVAVSGSAPIISSGGQNPVISISNATTSANGAMSSTDKTKLDGITPGAAVSGVSGTAPIVSSGGTAPAISITAATPGAAGSMSAADKGKLDTISANAAVASVSGTAPITSSGGASPAIGINAATGAAAGSMSAADKAKLDLMTYVDATAWTPVLTFATPGNLAVTYASQVGTYTRVGHLVIAQFSIRTSAFTWTTSSGSLLVTGLPLSLSAAIPEAVGKISWVGITAAGFTEISCNLRSATPNQIEFIASASGAARAVISTGSVPSGGTVVLIGTIVFPA